MYDRVATWQAKLEPVLEAEAARREFNIVTYGDEILERLEVAVPLLQADSAVAAAAAATASSTPSPAVTVPFSALVGGDGARFEVCRAFLAALQVRRHRRVGLQYPPPPPKDTHTSAPAPDPLQLAADSCIEIVPPAATAAAAQPAAAVAAASRGRRRGAPTAATDTSWMFSQAPEAMVDDEGLAAAADARGAVEATRDTALQTAFASGPAAAGFAVRLLGDGASLSSRRHRAVAAAVSENEAALEEEEGVSSASSSSMLHGVWAEGGNGELAMLPLPDGAAREQRRGAYRGVSAADASSAATEPVSLAPVVSRRGRAVLQAAATVDGDTAHLQDGGGGGAASPPLKRTRLGRTAAGGAENA